MKENKSDISVILPVHELDETTKVLFNQAVKSVELQQVKPSELLIVVPKGSEVNSYIKSLDFDAIKDIIRVVENEGETDFSSQINLGVKEAKSEWISILELDDEYATIWFKNVVNYQNAHPNVGIFLPLIVNTTPDGNFIGFSNEPVWANSFSDELGVLDLNALLAYQGFNTDGMVMRKSIFEEMGGFKPSIKLTFIYEFLLRMTFKDVRVMAIPRFGYKHVVGRPNSLFEQYTQTLDPIEAKWWLTVSKKEYYFDKDRKITYEKSLA